MDKGVLTFPKGICPKVKVITRLELELAHNDTAVQRFNHFTPKCRFKKRKKNNEKVKLK